MNIKIRIITGWALGGIVLLLLAASAVDKIIGSPHSLEMTHSFGITPSSYRLLGIIELTLAILFLVSRTGILGLRLLSFYLGGAIATHLQHGQNILFPIGIVAIVWIAAIVRYPEITDRIGSTRKQ